MCVCVRVGGWVGVRACVRACVCVCVCVHACVLVSGLLKLAGELYSSLNSRYETV